MLWHCIFQKAVLSKAEINASTEASTLLQSDIKNLKTAVGGLFTFNVTNHIYIIRDILHTLQVDLIVMGGKKTAWKNPGKLEQNAYEQGIHI